MRHLIRLASLFYLLALIAPANAQSLSLSGTLIDTNDSVVPAASLILLQANDSVFVKGTTSNNDGDFTIEKLQPGNYRLVVQDLLYEQQNIPVDFTATTNLGTILLKEKNQELDEISVKATRPVVRMKDNTLSYDVATISAKKVHTNALEVLDDVPGVLLKNDNIELIGASQLNIAINGKPTTLSFEQVMNQLKAMPNTSIKEVQVMYAPPAKYNVKGALINLVLTKAKTNELNGSVHTTYRQRRNSGDEEGINLQYAKTKWDINLLYGHDDDHRREYDQIDINHTYRDTLYQIRQNMHLHHKTSTPQVQLNTNFYIDSVQTLSLSYSGSYQDKDGSPQTTSASFASIKGTYAEIDTSATTGRENIHHVKIDYELANQLNAGADYTYYNGPSTSSYRSVVDGEPNQFQTKSNQTINKWMVYANHSFNLWDTDFNYGGNYASISNENYYQYFDWLNEAYAIDETQSSENKYQEIAASGFISFSKQFSSHFTFDFSMKGEFDRMRKDSMDTHINMWNTFYWYPTLNASFMPDADMNHIWQLAVKSYTTYPTYWELSPATWYTNQYMLVQGNPELKPSQTYTGTLTYIFKRKYMAILSNEYTRNLISQIPFASNESFNTVARNENVDFQNDLSLMVVLPFSLGKHISVTPTTGYVRRRMKKDSPADQAFDRQTGIFIFQCDNDISISERRGLKVNLSGYYYGGGIQGIYDFSSSYGVSLGASCQLLKDKATLSLKVDDLFNSQIPDLHINFNNQQSHYQLDQDMRLLSLTFRYNFGKPFKTKKIETDDSRFRRMN